MKQVTKYGNHSDTHPHVNKLSKSQNISEIESCNSKIEAIINKKVTLYRCPYGEYNNTVIDSVQSINMKAIQWNLDTLDYNGLTGDEMWKRLDGKISNGSIILMHNGTKHTADSLEQIIINIKASGYNIVKVSDLVYDSNYYIDSTGMQVQK